MDEILRVVVLPVALVGLIIGVFYVFFGRQKVPREDPPGLRSFATFRAPKGLLAELTGGAEDHEPSEAGSALVDALSQELGRRAVTLGTIEAANYGHSLEARCGETSYMLRLGWVGDKAEDGTPLDWLLSVDPSRQGLSDNQDLRRLLLELSASLAALRTTHLRWHRREDWLAGRAAGNARPLDRSLS